MLTVCWQAARARSDLEYTVLKDMVAYTEIIYDPDPRSTVVSEDLDTVETWAELEEVHFVAFPLAPC